MGEQPGFKARRRALGLSRDRVSKDLALPPGWLDAVEAGEAGVIPAAKQIPVESALERYLLHREAAHAREVSPSRPRRGGSSAKQRIRQERNRALATWGPSLGLLRTVAFVLAGVALYIAYLEARSNFGGADGNGSAVQVVEVPRALNLEVFVRAPVRVRVLADGEVVDDVKLKPGDERVYRGDVSVELDVEEVGAVRLRLNGSTLAPLGRSDLPRVLRFVRSARHAG